MSGVNFKNFGHVPAARANEQRLPFVWTRTTRGRRNNARWASSYVYHRTVQWMEFAKCACVTLWLKLWLVVGGGCCTWALIIGVYRTMCTPHCTTFVRNEIIKRPGKIFKRKFSSGSLSAFIKTVFYFFFTSSRARCLVARKTHWTKNNNIPCKSKENILKSFLCFIFLQVLNICTVVCGHFTVYIIFFFFVSTTFKIKIYW